MAAIPSSSLPQFGQHDLSTARECRVKIPDKGHSCSRTFRYGSKTRYMYHICLKGDRSEVVSKCQASCHHEL